MFANRSKQNWHIEQEDNKPLTIASLAQSFSDKDLQIVRDVVLSACNGKASDVVRVFPVPGMTHCGGGPAASNFDAFSALIDWVEHKKAPDSLVGVAGGDTSWPGRTRPICAYPAIAIYQSGDAEIASSFSCSLKKY